MFEKILWKLVNSGKFFAQLNDLYALLISEILALCLFVNVGGIDQNSATSDKCKHIITHIFN